MQEESLVRNNDIFTLYNKIPTRAEQILFQNLLQVQKNNTEEESQEWLSVIPFFSCQK